MSVVPRDPYDPVTALQWRILHDLYPDDYLREVQKAMTIAKDRDTCVALLRGESVTADRVDWDKAQGYGMRL